MPAPASRCDDFAAEHRSRSSFSFSRSGENENDYEKENDSVIPVGCGYPGA
jgi:hypothetical protein